MSDKKLTDLADELEEAPANTDVMHIVDVSDTTQHADGSSKKIQISNLLANAGTTDHAALSNKDYASAGHTGFEPTVTKGDLTAGSNKITIGGTGTGAVIGVGATVDVAEANVDHGGLAGLPDDDHAGHPWLVGRAGGQILKGGTNASDDLYLYSNSATSKEYFAAYGEAGLQAYKAEILQVPKGTARARYVHKRYSELQDLPPSISCKKGCSHCCHLMVDISEDEEALMAVHIDLCNFKQLERQKDLTIADFPGEDLELSRCCFLKDGACSIYEDRPLTCRALVVTSDPDLCARPKDTAQDHVYSVEAEVFLSAYLSIAEFSRLID